MKYFLIGVLLGTLGVATYLLNVPTATFGAVTYSYESHEGWLIRYFAKMELNKGKSIWDSNPHVQRVKNADGTLNFDKVKELLSERNIMTPEQFDTAFAVIKSDGYLDNKNTATQKATSAYGEYKTLREATLSSPPSEDTTATSTDI